MAKETEINITNETDSPQEPQTIDSAIPTDEQISSNKRIAKNTIFLYFRMLITMVVGLFTSRVVLNTLGVEDYGINNVAGGLIAFLSIITGTITAAISRFITYELGRGDIVQLKNVFATSVTIQLILALIVFVLGEIVGIWFLDSELNIPVERLEAAKWVFHCAIISFSIGLICSPYNATIIAHERMSIYAYMSILETILKLAIVYLLYISPFDKLKTFAVLGVATSILMRIIYGWYCKRNFEECRYRFSFDKKLFKEMFNMASWHLFGNTAYILNTQGVNVITNIFFGVALNAARGIADMVNGIVTQFVNNFTTAINPQITKSYAKGDLDNMHKLICYGSKYSYFMMLAIATPVIIEAESILTLWLGIVPEYAVVFTQLVLASSLCTVLSNALVTAMLATGKIKKYQLVVTAVGFIVFPLTYIAFKLGFSPSWAYIIYFFTYLLLLFVRLYLMREMIKMPMMLYIKKVIYRIIPATLFILVIPYLVKLHITPSISRIFIIGGVSIIVSIISIYLMGLSNSEQNFVRNKLIAITKRNINNVD